MVVRLIDADALNARLSRDGTPYFTVTDIDNAPTVPAEPIINARWIHFPDCGVSRCSRCNWSIEECWDSKRCPECGAHMRNGG